MDFKDRVLSNMFESSSDEPNKKPTMINPRSLDFIQNRLTVALRRRDWDIIKELLVLLSLRN